MRFALLAALICLAQPALAAGGWTFVNDPDEFKFGHQNTGKDGFDTIWFRCDNATRQIVVSLAAGNKRPASGRVTVLLSDGSEKVTVEGPVSDDEFDGVYWLELNLARDHALFGLMKGGRSLLYSAHGWRRPHLSNRGQKRSAERFLAACR